MDDYVFIETVNIAYFKDEDFDLEAEENAHLREDLKITPDGKILAVKRSRVSKIAQEKEVFLVRMRMAKMPREFNIKTDEDFWRCLAHLVDLDEDL